MKTLTKKIVSVMMAATFLGAAPVVLPEALKPAAITASAYRPPYADYRVPVYGYNYGWYPHTGNNSSYDRECIKFIQAWYNEIAPSKGWPLIAVDGYYGYNTTQAVLRWQNSYNNNPETGWLNPDGIFGPNTYEALMGGMIPYSGQLYRNIRW
ncbi:MAG: peptidoglycan-binding protein [Oscillospiraceae bacterium]|nr:peptidoglycan-binding protein [Oscillospiraceae bacterium]